MNFLNVNYSAVNGFYAYNEDLRLSSPRDNVSKHNNKLSRQAHPSISARSPWKTLPAAFPCFSSSRLLASYSSLPV